MTSTAEIYPGKYEAQRKFSPKRVSTSIQSRPMGISSAPDDKHLLVPDSSTADVVRRIFSLIADGYTTEMVARLLKHGGCSNAVHDKGRHTKRTQKLA